MRGLKKTRRIQVIVVAAVALGLSTALIGYAMRDGINFFRSPTQIVQEPPGEREVFRVGGLVEVGSIIRGQGATVEFRVTDGANAVPVVYTGVLPDLFGDGEGAVATGRWVDGRFEAHEVLARHDETYMPREVVEALQEQGMWMPGGPQAGAAQPRGDGAANGAAATN